MDDRHWAGKKTLITGATGIIGSRLVRAILKRGAEVVALVRDVDPQTEFYRNGLYRRTRIVNGRLEDIDTLERAIGENGVECVFHLGAQTLVTMGLRCPLQTFESNIRGSYNLLEASRRNDDLVRGIVIASSDKAYGPSENLPYSEDMPLAGRYPYDVSKSCTDLLGQTYHETYALPVTIARCGNVFGPGDLNWSRIVPGTIRSVLFNERPIIRSDGQFARDYFYVDDAVEAYLMLAEQAGADGVGGEAFNFGTGTQVTVLELVEVILKLMGREDLEPDVRSAVTAEIRNQSLDATKARNVLGWRPRWDLREGLIETIRWYEGYFRNRAS